MTKRFHHEVCSFLKTVLNACTSYHPRIYILADIVRLFSVAPQNGKRLLSLTEVRNKEKQEQNGRMTKG